MRYPTALSFAAFISCTALALLGSCASPSQPEKTATGTGPPVYIFAGTGVGGRGDLGLRPKETELYWPEDIVFGPDSTAIVIDWNNHRILADDKSTHRFKLIAGAAPTDGFDPCPPSPTPCTNIPATTAALNHPTHIAFDANGNIVLCAWHNSDLFLLNTSTGLMDRICGTGARPCYNGDEQPAASACVDLPCTVAFDPAGRICFTDQGNMIVRMIDENGMIHCIAGSPPLYNPDTGRNDILQYGYSGDEGPATSAKLSFERGQIADPSGKICFDNAGNMYIADTSNNCVRFVDPQGIIHLLAGHPPDAGFRGDGGPAKGAYLRGPRDVAVGLHGNIYIADTDNNVIRMVDKNGMISTVVGVPRHPHPSPLEPNKVLAEDGEHSDAVHLTGPSGIEVDPFGNLWIADTENNVIRVLYR
jgi:DNA-binding beta-propeller fold protein YncE